jgi:hypothetical protein
MRAKRIVFLAGAWVALASGARASTAQPMVLTDLTGSLHVQQSTPSTCNTVDETTPVVGGRLEITPAEGYDFGGIKYFVISAGTVSFAPFTAHVSCLAGTASHTRAYTEIAVQMAQAAEFFGFPTGAPQVYAASVPRQNLLLYQASLVNGGLETGYKRPKEDVAATIDLAQGTVTLQVVIGTKVHVEWPSGCASNPVVPCIFDEDREGTLTATLAGRLVFPDTDGDGIPDRDDNCPFVPNRAQEAVPPILRVPGTVTVASCAERRWGPAIGVDACRDLPAVVTTEAEDPLRPGPNAVVWTATDAQGGTSTARQTVTVVDRTPPVFTSLPLDVERTDCGPAGLGLPEASDDCGGVPRMSHDAPASFGLGRTEVTWTATDAFANQAAVRQAVTVTDAVAPTASCVRDPHAPRRFQVSARDACSAPVIRLGEFVLADGETVLIVERVRPGVGLRHRGPVRIFAVGRGEAAITATDASGNVGRAECR